MINEPKSLFESVFDSAVHSIIVINNKGVIQSYNPSAQKMFQYSSKEVVGKNISMLMSSDDAKMHGNHLSQYNKTGKKSIIGNGRNVVGIRKDGTKINAFLSVSEFNHKKDKYFVGIMHDVSELVAANKENSSLIEFVDKILDALNKTEDYKLLISHILREISILFGFEIGHFYQYKANNDYLVSSNIFYCKHEERCRTFVNITKKTCFKKGEGLPGSAWKKNEIINFENVYKTKLFKRSKLTQKLNIIGAVAFPIVYKDILLGVVEFFSAHPLKLTAPQINQLKSIAKIISVNYGIYHENYYLNLILSSAGEGVYGLDNDGIATFVNPAACKILGYSSHELVGSKLHDKIHYKYPDGSHYPNDKCYIYAAFRDGLTHRISGEVLWRKDGKAVPVEYTSTPIYKDGELSGAVVVFLDITKEDTIRNHISHIEQLQESYISGASLSNIFHDCLQYILTYTKSSYGFIATLESKESELHMLKVNLVLSTQKTAGDVQYIQQSNQTPKNLNTFNHCIQQVILTGKKIYLNADDCLKQKIKLPLTNQKTKSFLCVAINNSKGVTAILGIANSTHPYDDELLNQLTPFTGTLSSIIESSKNYSIIDDLAKIDALTKVYNRHYFEKYFTQLLKESYTKNLKFGLLLIDLNNFKRVNDVYGHICGDQLLIEFTKALVSLVKDKDIIARIGGDEFVIILLDIKEYEHAELVARRIIKKAKKSYNINGEIINCPPSIGIIGYPLSGTNKQQLMKRADFALYNAKENNQGWAFFTDLLEEKYVRNCILEEAISDGFLKQEFYCMYQPQVNINDESIYGVEVLMRWLHPILGEILPCEFIPIIEKTGKSAMLNSYVIKQTIKIAPLIHSTTPMQISINISPKTHDFSEHIKDILLLLEKSSTNENVRYCLEMTESDFESSDYSNTDSLSDSLNLLKEHNIDFAIDDFGVKHSSINRLISYEFDEIKIDQIFTKKLDKKNNKSAKAVIKAIMALSHDLEFNVVAEGAETKAQVQALSKLGCKVVQGFYYYKPLDFADLLKLLGNES
jgi:diguanylate cyclase (GGDEF)-like protein/PAS domain S-box-containing protein